MANKKYLSNRYADYEFEDETSGFDPRARWNAGGEYYEATYQCRVPRTLLEQAERKCDYSRVENWIANHSERGIWLNTR